MFKFSNVVQQSFLIGCTLLGASVAAAQEPDSGAVAIPVVYGDLDLTKEQDAQELYQRLRVAARHACRRTYDQPLAGLAEYRACTAAALQDAVRKFNSETLTILHAQTRSNAS
jgi:UrcA family protein